MYYTYKHSYQKQMTYKGIVGGDVFLDKRQAETKKKFPLSYTYSVGHYECMYMCASN